jgi:hypothetical protein
MLKSIVLGVRSSARAARDSSVFEQHRAHRGAAQHAQPDLLVRLQPQLAHPRRGIGQRRRHEHVELLKHRPHRAARVGDVGARALQIGGREGPPHLAEKPRGGLEILGRGGLPNERRGVLDGHRRTRRDDREVREAHGLPVDGERHLHHVVAELAEGVRRVLKGLDAVGVRRVAQDRPRREADAKTARVAAYGVCEGPRGGGDDVGRPRVGAVRRVEQGRRIAHAAGEDVGYDEAVPAFADVGAQGHTPAGGLEPEEPASRSRDTNRPAAVARVRRGDDARSHRRGRSAARSAGGVFEAPGVAGGAVEGGLGDGDDAKLGRVGLAEDDQTRGLVAFGEHAAPVGDLRSS